ncbi:MAG: translation initiation factor IF-2 [Candidatus Methylomirabilia bacterium]
MAGRMKVTDLAKELGVTSKDLLVALEGMGLKGKRAMSPLDQATANKLRLQLGRGRELPTEAKPKRSTAAGKAAAKEVAVKAAPRKKVPGERPAPAKKGKRRGLGREGAEAAVIVAPEPLEISPEEAVELEAGVSRLPMPEAPAPPLVPADEPAVAVAPPVATPAEPKTAPPAPAPAAPKAPERVSPPRPPRGRPSPPVLPHVVPPAAVAPAAPVVHPPETLEAEAVAPPAVTLPREEVAAVAPPVEVKRERIKAPESVTVAELAEKMRRKSAEVIKALIEMGVMATLNEILDPTAAKLVADRFNFDLEIVSLEGAEMVEDEVDPTLLRPRPPVVTVMGHVDHGKTSLLDTIRRTKVAEKEFGGITQHIGAYQVETAHGKVTFLDTPGHEAFTAMRARGAQATDVVILVVAADDGVRPQTVEAIHHARAAAVPIIVAINKIDKPGADAERAKRELATHGLVSEEWGGQTIVVETSAKRGTGIDQLLEMTALQAEIMELKANSARAARGVIVEAKLDRGRGPVATVLVSQGSLREGDAVVVGQCYGRVRAMFDERGKKVKEAGPADPVEILGLSGVPLAGDRLQGVEDERKARQIATVRQEREKAKAKTAVRVTLDDLRKRVEAGEVKEFRLILKADVQGSVEALTEALERLSTDEVGLKVIHGSVGAITENDVNLASASNAVVLGFNVRPEPKVAAQAQTEGVDLRTYNVIYEVVNDVKAALEGMLAPEIREVAVGKAEVRALFTISRLGTVLGSYVVEGKIVRNAKVRVRRDGAVLGEGTISSLKRFKDDVREVAEGLECGIGVDDVGGVQVGDVIEAYTTEEVARTL